MRRKLLGVALLVTLVVGASAGAASAATKQLWAVGNLSETIIRPGTPVELTSYLAAGGAECESHARGTLVTNGWAPDLLRFGEPWAQDCFHGSIKGHVSQVKLALSGQLIETFSPRLVVTTPENCSYTAFELEGPLLIPGTVEGLVTRTGKLVPKLSAAGCPATTLIKGVVISLTVGEERVAVETIAG